MQNHLTFHSTLADLATWDERGAILEPAGREHARLLCTELGKGFPNPTEPWNEEDFGWEFLCEVNGICMGVLIQEDWNNGTAEAGNWLLILHPVVMLKFLYRKRITHAVTLLTNTIAQIVDNDERLSDLRNYSLDELEARDAKAARSKQ